MNRHTFTAMAVIVVAMCSVQTHAAGVFWDGLDLDDESATIDYALTTDIHASAISSWRTPDNKYIIVEEPTDFSGTRFNAAYNASGGFSGTQNEDSFLKLINSGQQKTVTRIDNKISETFTDGLLTRPDLLSDGSAFANAVWELKFATEGMGTDEDENGVGYFQVNNLAAGAYAVLLKAGDAFAVYGFAALGGNTVFHYNNRAILNGGGNAPALSHTVAVYSLGELNAVPEPTALVGLASMGLFGLIGLARQKRRR